jgi:hypothetical protein
MFSSLTSCSKGLTGNGNVITKERTVTTFSSLAIKGVFNVFINQGDKETVKIETDENLQDIIETINKDNILTIKTKDKISLTKSTKMNVYVTIKDLTNIDIDGVGAVSTTSTLKLENMELKFSGVGNVSLEMNCKTLNADISAVGNIMLKGSADEAKMTVSGTGSLSAFDFTVQNLTIDLSGIGNADVHAENEISITSSGVGNVSYTGNAVVKKMNTSGIGKVKKINR